MKFNFVFTIIVFFILVSFSFSMNKKKNLKCKDDINNATEALKKGSGGMTFGTMTASCKLLLI